MTKTVMDFEEFVVHIIHGGEKKNKIKAIILKQKVNFTC